MWIFPLAFLYLLFRDIPGISGSYLGNSAVALLFKTLFELHCLLAFFLASVTNLLVKIYENNCFSGFKAEAKLSSGGRSALDPHRSALDSCPNTQLPPSYSKLELHMSCRIASDQLKSSIDSRSETKILHVSRSRRVPASAL